jgi:hypothetical protein
MIERMAYPNDDLDWAILQGIAKRAMLERGLFACFSAEPLAELNTIQSPSTIDNLKAHDSKDLL